MSADCSKLWLDTHDSQVNSRALEQGFPHCGQSLPASAALAADGTLPQGANQDVSVSPAPAGATDCSPGRKPGVSRGNGRIFVPAPEGAKDNAVRAFSAAPYRGSILIGSHSPGLRPGLHSAARPGLRPGNSAQISRGFADVSPRAGEKSGLKPHLMKPAPPLRDAKLTDYRSSPPRRAVTENAG